MTIEARYQQLQSQNQQVEAALQQLAAKLSAAAQGGDSRAREWLLDLREVAVNVQAEENSVGELVTAMHDFAAGSLQAATVPGSPYPGQLGYAPPAPSPQGYPAPAYAGPGYSSPGAQGAAGAGAGGALSHLLGSGIGRAVASGAGFGLGDDLIQGLFGR